MPRRCRSATGSSCATRDDAEELAAFNANVHADEPGEPDRAIEAWTRDLLDGDHPATTPQDVTVVVDSRAGGRIVSTACLISQTWSYDGLPLRCGRIELVGTDAAFRRRGLIRRQFEVLHARSASKGDRMQAITGVPWYYRQFGYEMAMALQASRLYAWDRPGNLVPVEEEAYRWRPATDADRPLLERLYAIHCRASMVARLRTETEWRYEMDGARRESPYRRDFRVVETASGQAVAYVEFCAPPPAIYVREMAVLDGCPWRPVLAFLARALKGVADERNASGPAARTGWLQYGLGIEHPAYDALGGQLEPPRPAYAWYVRVADLPGFLAHIAPVLEQRLAASVMAGHTGTLRLNFFTSRLALEFQEGRLVGTSPFELDQVEGGDAHFPDLTFLQLLFGHRDLAELQHARADCYARNAGSQVLLGVLFPKRASAPNGLG